MREIALNGLLPLSITDDLLLKYLQNVPCVAEPCYVAPPF